MSARAVDNHQSLAMEPRDIALANSGWELHLHTNSPPQQKVALHSLEAEDVPWASNVVGSFVANSPFAD